MILLLFRQEVCSLKEFGIHRNKRILVCKVDPRGLIFRVFAVFDANTTPVLQLKTPKD